jgi:putative inorganic carbon (hco3(-)) transporter
MLSLVIIFLILMCIPFGFRYPFFGFCLYIWLDYVAPDRMFSGAYSEAFRLSLMTVAVTFFGWLLFERNSKLGPSVALKLLIIFGLWVSITTVLSVFPITAAAKYERFIKNLVIVVLGVFLIDTKERLLITMGTIFAATAIHSARGAAITIVTGGGGYSVVGTQGTYLEERNYIAMAFLMAVSFGIFFMRYFKREGYPKWSRWAAGLGTVCCMISVVGTQSRGALVAAGATALVSILFAKRRVAALITIVLMTVVVAFLAPDAWITRMRSIGEYSEDNASTSRLDTWRFAWDYAMENPIFGGGFSIFLANKNDTSSLGYFDAHSLYFEVLAEHGFIGLAILISMLGALLFSLFRGAIRTKRSAAPLIPEMQFFLLTASVSLFVAGIFGVLSPFLMTYVPILLAAAYQRVEYLKLKEDKGV